MIVSPKGFGIWDGELSQKKFIKRWEFGPSALDYVFHHINGQKFGKWVTLDFRWPGPLRLVQFCKKNGQLLWRTNDTWIHGWDRSLLRIKNHWISLQILIERPFAFRGPRLTIHGCRSQNIPSHPHFYYIPIIIPIITILPYIIIIIIFITPHPHFY